MQAQEVIPAQLLQIMVGRAARTEIVLAVDFQKGERRPPCQHLPVVGRAQADPRCRRDAERRGGFHVHPFSTGLPPAIFSQVPLGT